MYNSQANKAIEGLSPSDVLLITEGLRQEYGIDLGVIPDYTLRRRLSLSLSALRCPTATDLLWMCQIERSNLGHFLDSLYPSENEFFRDHEVWTLLKASILPSYLKSKNISIAFFDSISGETLYSMAILLHEFFPDARVAMHLFSPSDQSIARMKSGYLRNKKMELGFQNYQLVSGKKDFYSYFSCYKGIYTFNTDYIKTVEYHKTGLPDYKPEGTFDIIFARNKFMFYRREMLSGLCDKLTRSLNPNGILILGVQDWKPDNASGLNYYSSGFRHIYTKKS
jgi:chemotaxis methyl-accepting protein methylase